MREYATRTLSEAVCPVQIQIRSGIQTSTPAINTRKNIHTQPQRQPHSQIPNLVPQHAAVTPQTDPSPHSPPADQGRGPVPVPTLAPPCHHAHG
ncbi:hypothetical protein K439DRAFT_776493 [Ramaria rubella]|nr:hypothetical protein K439DRAFT_776493 [Ramaria rubella]